MDPARLYEEDFYAWTQFQARELLRLKHRGSNRALDLEHLAEEVRDLGRAERNALRSYARRIIEHLLLLEHSSANEPRQGWGEEIIEFRLRLEIQLTPTLQRDLERQLERLYVQASRALRQRLQRYEEPTPDLPDDCPYTLDQLLGDWWPERLD